MKKRALYFLPIAALTMCTMAACKNASDDTLGAPANLQAKHITHKSVTLTWQSTNAEMHEVLIVGDVEAERPSVTVLEPKLQLNDLTPECKYTWKVRSGKSGAWTEWVDGTSFTTEVAPPPAPLGVETIGVTIDSAILTWLQGEGTKHEVVFDDREPHEVPRGDYNNYLYGVWDLEPETTHTWQVRSFVDGEWTDWSEVQQFTTKSLSLLPKDEDFVWVEPGSFMMGCEEDYAFAQEKPAHQVTLTEGFWICKYEVTQEQWFTLIDENPAYHKGDKRPIDGVFAEEAMRFIDELNTVTGKQYALPTEAQWEFAARGGNQSKGYKFSGSNNIDDVAWYYGNSAADTTHDVGTKAPNELGLYDMTGNVMEWCSDLYADDYYASSPSTDPTGAETGGIHSSRGGGWSVGEKWCHVSFRQAVNPESRNGAMGFRLIRME